MTAFLSLCLIGLCCTLLSRQLRKRPFSARAPRLWLYLALLAAGLSFPFYGVALL